MTTLTHNMRKRRDGIWECVDCKREGTIAEINEVKCAGQHRHFDHVMDAIEGTGKFAKENK